MNNQKNIVLCGVGGQGTVLASKLLAAAAMSKDIPVMSAETIGMAQRGGSVFRHLRLSDLLNSQMIETLYTWQGDNNALLRDRLFSQKEERAQDEEERRKAFYK